MPGPMTRFHRLMSGFYSDCDRLKGERVSLSPSLTKVRGPRRIVGPPPTITWGGPRLTPKVLAGFLDHVFEVGR